MIRWCEFVLEFGIGQDATFRGGARVELGVNAVLLPVAALSRNSVQFNCIRYGRLVGVRSGVTAGIGQIR